MPFYNYLDTSAVLTTGVLASCQHCYISNLVLREMENIKTSKNKDDEVKAAARAATREIIKNPMIVSTPQPRDKIEKIFKKNSILPDTNDSRIICEALYLVKLGYDITFMTADKAQYCLASTFPELNVRLVENTTSVQEVYNGWKNYYLSDEQFDSIYSEATTNILQCPTNEFAKLYEKDELKDVVFWDGAKYRKLQYKELYNKTFGEKIKPRNLEQKCAFDLLQNSTIAIKLITGCYGSGKDFIMLHHALDQVERGYKDKIIFIRQATRVKDSEDIGLLPGTIEEKLQWTLRPVQDILGGEDALRFYLERDAIESVNLGFIRGASFKNSIVYVTEGQNLTVSQMQLLISRLGDNSELYINGDYKQTDKAVYAANNGIAALKKILKGNKLFGYVNLIKTERSEASELASLFDD